MSCGLEGSDTAHNIHHSVFHHSLSVLPCKLLSLHIMIDCLQRCLYSTVRYMATLCDPHNCIYCGRADCGWIIVGYPEAYFARMKLPSNIIISAIQTIRGDDIYRQTDHFLLPEHRTAALASQVNASLMQEQLSLEPAG